MVDRASMAELCKDKHKKIIKSYKLINQKLSSSHTFNVERRIGKLKLLNLNIVSCFCCYCKTFSRISTCKTCVSRQGSDDPTVCYTCNYSCLLCLGLMGMDGGLGGGILKCN